MTFISESFSLVLRRCRRVDIWSLGAIVIAALVVLPVLSVLWLAFFPSENIWPHLMATTLPRYMFNTILMMVSVGGVTVAVGTGAAWILTQYRFVGSRWLSWLMLLPLAIPAYVGAYALVDFLEYAGPVQTALRSVFGWETSRDYWFPEIRSRGAAIVVLSAALYPYVYLMARVAFNEQSGSRFEVAQALGAGPFRRFWRVGVPLARPAIAAGAAIAMMETVSDFGTVEFFAVQTLTTGIFSTWYESHNAGGASQIACVVLILVLVLVALEKTSRRRLRYHNTVRNQRVNDPVALTGVWAMAAFALCVVPFLIGFVMPVGVIARHALRNAELWSDDTLWTAAFNTVWVGMTAAVIAVGLAVFMVYAVRMTGRRLPRFLLPVTTLGYAAPGAVLGVGILIPMAQLDHWIADMGVALFGVDVGLLMTGTAFAIIVAYVVRFFAIAQGAVDAAMGRVAPSLPLAARSLGQSKFGALRRVYFPLMRGSIGTALLLVFVDSVKELPATLLLRPFGFDTLATQVYEHASLENLGDASPAAVIVIAVGIGAVLLLARAQRKG